MNKEAFLQETYNSAFNDELEKIAKTGWESEFDDIRRESNKKGRWFPALGMAGGVAASVPIMNAVAKRVNNPIVMGTALGAAGFAGMAGGTVLGLKAKDMAATRYLKNTPGSEEYQKIRELNKAGLNPDDKKLMKSYSDDFNQSVGKDRKPMTDKTHLKMRKELIGW